MSDSSSLHKHGTSTSTGASWPSVCCIVVKRQQLVVAGTGGHGRTVERFVSSTHHRLHFPGFPLHPTSRLSLDIVDIIDTTRKDSRADIPTSISAPHQSRTRPDGTKRVETSTFHPAPTSSPASSKQAERTGVGDIRASRGAGVSRRLDGYTIPHGLCRRRPKRAEIG